MKRFEWLVIGCAGLAWIPGLRMLAETWRAHEFTTHGFLVPFVALWAATAHREALRARAAEPMRGALPLLAVCSLAYLGALAMRQPTLLGVVFVATVVALVLALRGRAWAEQLAFPLAYLVFLIPLPIAWVTPVIVWLQLVVSQVAVAILQFAGIAILREGNVLHLPGDVSLFVAEACSGITSLLTLIPIGVFVAYFTESRLSRRIALVVAVLPIALLGNLARVVLTVLVAQRAGSAAATEGPLHEWAGVATYVLGCLGLLAVGAVLRRVWPEPDSPDAA